MGSRATSRLRGDNQDAGRAVSKGGRSPTGGAESLPLHRPVLPSKGQTQLQPGSSGRGNVTHPSIPWKTRPHQILGSSTWASRAGPMNRASSLNSTLAPQIVAESPGRSGRIPNSNPCQEQRTRSRGPAQARCRQFYPNDDHARRRAPHDASFTRGAISSRPSRSSSLAPHKVTAEPPGLSRRAPICQAMPRALDGVATQVGGRQDCTLVKADARPDIDCFADASNHVCPIADVYPLGFVLRECRRSTGKGARSGSGKMTLLPSALALTKSGESVPKQ